MKAELDANQQGYIMLRDPYDEITARVSELSDTFLKQARDISEMNQSQPSDTAIMLAVLVIGYIYSINVTKENRETLRTDIWTKLTKILDEVDIERGIQSR